jgi:hypothetical protein
MEVQVGGSSLGCDGLLKFNVVAEIITTLASTRSRYPQSKRSVGQPLSIQPVPRSGSEELVSKSSFFFSLSRGEVHSEEVHEVVLISQCSISILAISTF